MRGRNGGGGVSPGFLFLVAVLFYLDTSGMVLLSLLSGILHEWGHYRMLRWLNNDVRAFRLTVFGARMEPEFPMNFVQEFIIAAAGPAVNLLLAVIFARVPGGAAFAGVNLALGGFNLLPVGELDGARMLRSLLSAVFSDAQAYSMCWCLDFSFTVIISCVGIVMSVCYGNLTLLLMCLWLILRRRGEKMWVFQKKNGKRGCQTGIKRLK